MGSLGPMEILLIFLAILLIFGAKRIPEIARGLGKGIREFKTATQEITNEFNVNENQRIQSPRPPAQTPTPRAAPAQQQPAQQQPAQQQPAQQQTAHTDQPGASSVQ